MTADASLWLHQKYSGKTCGDITTDDLSQIDQITDSTSRVCKAPSAISKSASGLNNIAETIFFERTAKKQLEDTNCEISSVDLFEKDDSLIKIRSDEIANKLPFIKEQTELANLAYFEFQQISGQNNVFAANCRNTVGSTRDQCFGDLEKRRIREKEAETLWLQRKGLVSATMGSLWNGSTEAMNEFIKKLLKYDPQPSNEIIFNALKRRIPKVKTELEENKAELLKQSTGSPPNIKFDNLNDETKRKLVEEAMADGEVFSEAIKKKDESSIKFMCRLEGRYTKGRDSLNRTIGTATLLIGGVAGFVSKIPLALRAGQLSNILSKAKSSAVVIGALATGVDASIAASAVLNKCFSASVSHSIKNACPANGTDFKKAEIKKFEQNNCILEAAISVAPAGLLASSKAIKSLLPKLKNENSVAKEMGGIPSQVNDVSTVKKEVSSAPTTSASSISSKTVEGNATETALKTSEAAKPAPVSPPATTHAPSTHALPDYSKIETEALTAKLKSDSFIYGNNQKYYGTLAGKASNSKSISDQALDEELGTLAKKLSDNQDKVRAQAQELKKRGLGGDSDPSIFQAPNSHSVSDLTEGLTATGALNNLQQSKSGFQQAIDGWNRMLKSLERVKTTLTKEQYECSREFIQIRLQRAEADLGEIKAKESSLAQSLKGEFSASEIAQSRKRWETSSTAPPENLPYMALGFSTDLNQFTSTMSRQLSHPVISFQGMNGFSDKHLELSNNYWEIAKNGRSHPSEVLQNVAKNSNNKSLLFNLPPNFNFNDFKSYLQNWRPRAGGSPGREFTNDELAIILSNKEIFDRVRWFRNGRELTFDELREIFGQTAPDLFRSP